MERLEQLLTNNLGVEMSELLIPILKTEDKAFNTQKAKLSSTISQTFNSPIVINNIRMSNAVPDLTREEGALMVSLIIKQIKELGVLSDSKLDFLREIFIASTEASVRAGEPDRIVVKVEKLNDKAILPTYAHIGDAGADVYTISDITIEPKTTVIVPTGLKVSMPMGYEIQLRPRSGNSLKTPLRIPNSPATIDCLYAGEVGVLVENISDEPYSISEGFKIAQMVIKPVPMIEWEEVNAIKSNTERGEGGFGSSDLSE